MTWAELMDVCSVTLIQAEIPDARILARHYFQDVFGQVDKEIEIQPFQGSIQRAREDVARLIQGEPLAYVTGIAHFYGHKFLVYNSVLIPRPETEELVRWVLEEHVDENRYVLDLCTGSGCIAASLSSERPAWSILAVDIDPRAIEVAESNFIQLEVADKTRGEVHNVLLEENYLGEGNEWDIIVSNPPYIPDSDWARVDPMVSSFEPHLALRVGDLAPIQFYEAIAGTAKFHLKPGGYLYFECNDRYVIDVVSMLKKEGWQQVDVLVDMQGKERHVRGVKPV